MADSSASTPPEKTRIAVAGAGGRMGRAIIRAIAKNDDCQLSAALVSEGAQELGEDAGVLAGCRDAHVALTSDARVALRNADVVIDFSTPAASMALAALAVAARVPLVIGTTGFSAEQEKSIQAAARHTAIVKSGNMSLGVTLLASLVQQVAGVLAGFDVEILEMHHRLKVDAPSGTALLLGRAAAEGRQVALEDFATQGGQRSGPRTEGGIGFASLRGGTVVGEHHVIFAGPQERVVLSHVAEDRAIFAHGALVAAHWVRSQKPGLYSMREVLGLHI